MPFDLGSVSRSMLATCFISFPFLSFVSNGFLMRNTFILLQQTRSSSPELRPVGSEAETTPQQSLLHQLQRRNAVRGAVRLHAVALAALPPTTFEVNLHCKLSPALKALRSWFLSLVAVLLIWVVKESTLFRDYSNVFIFFIIGILSVEVISSLFSKYVWICVTVC